MTGARPTDADAAPQRLGNWLQHTWQQRGLAAWMLWPLSLAYAALVLARRALYQCHLLRSEHPGRPVVVIGNVIAGGAGKTPVVIALARHLQSRGLRPGVISRGYGRESRECIAVTADSSPREVGDEPALVGRSCPGVPVFVASRRIDAAKALLSQHPGTNVILCDDGLQHLALRRDIEVCVFNADGIGNGFLLPAGPLREPWPRGVDFILHAAPGLPRAPGAPAFEVRRQLASWAVRADGTRVPLDELKQRPVHALAGIARPDVFFQMLRDSGLTLAHTEALPDHYEFADWAPSADTGYAVVCTEKDAIKLWQRHPHALAVPLMVEIEASFFQALDDRLNAIRQA